MVFTYMRSMLPFLKHRNISSASTTMSRLQLDRIFRRMKFPGGNFSVAYFSANKHYLSKSFASPVVRKIPKRLKLWLNIMGLFSICFFRVERVPYSKRFHLVFPYPKPLESGLNYLNKLMLEKDGFGKPVSPPSDPRNIRVMQITKEILQAMHNGLELKNDFSIRALVSDEKHGLMPGPVNSVMKSSGFGNNPSMQFGRRCSTKHLEGREWKVLLVDSKQDNSFMGPDNTMIIFAGACSSDEHLAYTIAHEVGHAIAHSNRSLEVSRVGAFLLLKVASPLPWVKLKLKLESIYASLRQWSELEADHIGMMLMASAGFDPRAAPAFYRKVEAKYGNKDDHLSTHPNSGNRAKSMENPRMMTIAMSLYKEALAAKSRDT